MNDAESLIEKAFERLSCRPEFQSRENQTQLARFLGDLIAGGASGAIEAPTGLGKSLAALVPAIAHAIVNGKRTVIATYTNVLAEQYWQKDLPLALSLFDEPYPETAFLIGRQRYACLTAFDSAMPNEVDAFRAIAELGTESEFRRFSRKPGGQISNLWRRISAPPVCPARLCPAYEDCYFFRARRTAEKAPIVITNHSVVIQDGLNARDSDPGVGMLGNYDFLIIDEAHDFIQAAQSGLEFDLSSTEIEALKGLSARVETTLSKMSESIGRKHEVHDICEAFQSDLNEVANNLIAYGLAETKGGILTASPPDILEHPNLSRNRAQGGLEPARRIALSLSMACDKFALFLDREMEVWEEYRPDQIRLVRESIRNYLQYIRQMGGEASMLFEPTGIMVSYARSDGVHAELRSDTVGLAEPLEELVWSKHPHALLSATLVVDGTFEFINRTLGIRPEFEEVLDSPFDFSSQAALYVPKAGVIPDPSAARAQGSESEYYDALSAEVRRIILSVGGRTMALFHSRKEMEAVAERVNLPSEYPLYVQFRSGAGIAGERFREEIESSLFALRSYWTGFDAPGETLSCVALARVPFEVPIEPPALTRMAHLEKSGLNPFAAWTLPMAKMLIRQGAGRLIRSNEDKGVIALLDPRLRTKRYGEEIIDNLPANMRRFDDIDDAVGWIGLSDSRVSTLPRGGEKS